MLSVNADSEALLKPLGDLYFYENEYTLNFDLNLTAYYSNSNLHQNNTKLLKEKCGKRKDLTDCDFFNTNLKRISDLALKQTQYIKRSNKGKRSLCAIIVMAAIAVTTVVGSYFAAETATESSQQELIQQQNVQYNNTLNQLNLYERQLLMQNSSTNMLHTEIQHLKKEISETQYINQLLSSTLIAVDRHNKDTEKYTHALGNELYSKFFKVIDLDVFCQAIQKIKHNTTQNTPIFSLDMQDIVKISSIHSKMTNDTIRISVHIPLVSDEKMNILKFIPIPTMYKNTTVILERKPKILLKNNTQALEIPTAILSQCSQASNITICNTIFHNQLPLLDNCTNAVINRELLNSYCPYEKLPEKSQIMKISDKSVYIFILSNQFY